MFQPVKAAIVSVAERVLPESAFRQLVGAYGRTTVAARDQLQALRLRRFHNMYAGRRCFVIGNGPSLTVDDVRCLDYEVTIGCNGLFLMFEQMGFLPTFYTVEDRLVAEDRALEIGKIRRCFKIFPRDVAQFLRPDPDSYYINFVRNYPGFPKFTEDFAGIVYWGGTVTYLNLQLAYYLGCREIYLIGIDHNYAVPSAEEIDATGVITSAADDVNHFDPRYFGTGYRWHNPLVERMERSYYEARRFGAAHGMKIYNATRGGKLEVFPRVDFDRLF